MVYILSGARGTLRIPREVESQGLDFAEHHTYEDAVAEITAHHHEHINSNT